MFVFFFTLELDFLEEEVILIGIFDRCWFCLFIKLFIFWLDFFVFDIFLFLFFILFWSEFFLLLNIFSEFLNGDFFVFLFSIFRFFVSRILVGICGVLVWFVFIFIGVRFFVLNLKILFDSYNLLFLGEIVVEFLLVW